MRYDAMTTDRSYRKALPIGLALEELRSCAGTQFDPEVVRTLIGIVERQEWRFAPATLSRDAAVRA